MALVRPLSLHPDHLGPVSHFIQACLAREVAARHSCLPVLACHTPSWPARFLIVPVQRCACAWQPPQVLRMLEKRYGWQPMMEDGRIIGVALDGQSVTLEPGRWRHTALWACC